MVGTGLDGKRDINAIFMKILPGPFLASARRLMMVAALAAVSLSFGGSSAKAQGSVDLSTDHVTVDLSVIGDSGGYTFANGDKYVGEFKDNKHHGQGTLTYANGDKYVGEFKDGKQHGQGTVTYASGAKYVGEFKNGLANGQGIGTNSNGDKYVGEWKDNKSNGQGTQTYADGRVEEGIWENGDLKYAQKVTPTVTAKKTPPPSKGRKNPLSRLHVAVPKGPRIKLKPPSAKGKKAAKRVARKKLHVAVPKGPRIKLKPPSAKGKKAAKRVARKNKVKTETASDNKKIAKSQIQKAHFSKAERPTDFGSVKVKGPFGVEFGATQLEHPFDINFKKIAICGQEITGDADWLSFFGFTGYHGHKTYLDGAKTEFVFRDRKFEDAIYSDPPLKKYYEEVKKKERLRKKLRNKIITNLGSLQIGQKFKNSATSILDYFHFSFFLQRSLYNDLDLFVLKVRSYKKGTGWIDDFKNYDFDNRFLKKCEFSLVSGNENASKICTSVENKCKNSFKVTDNKTKNLFQLLGIRNIQFLAFRGHAYAIEVRSGSGAQLLGSLIKENYSPISVSPRESLYKKGSVMLSVKKGKYSGTNLTFFSFGHLLSIANNLMREFMDEEFDDELKRLSSKSLEIDKSKF
jgi:hypothetical protein